MTIDEKNKQIPRGGGLHQSFSSLSGLRTAWRACYNSPLGLSLAWMMQGDHGGAWWEFAFLVRSKASANDIRSGTMLREHWLKPQTEK